MSRQGLYSSAFNKHVLQGWGDMAALGNHGFLALSFRMIDCQMCRVLRFFVLLERSKRFNWSFELQTYLAPLANQRRYMSYFFVVVT